MWKTFYIDFTDISALTNAVCLGCVSTKLEKQILKLVFPDLIVSLFCSAQKLLIGLHCLLSLSHYLSVASTESTSGFVPIHGIVLFLKAIVHPSLLCSVMQQTTSPQSPFYGSMITAKKLFQDTPALQISTFTLTDFCSIPNKSLCIWIPPELVVVYGWGIRRPGWKFMWHYLGFNSGRHSSGPVHGIITWFQKSHDYPSY